MFLRCIVASTSPTRIHDPSIRLLACIHSLTHKQYAKEMDRANTKHHVYPANLQRVQLTERDDLQPILRQKARRFDIRAPPSPCHLSTAECLAWVVACVEEDPALYDALMKPLDLMVHKWRSFSNAGKNGPTTKEGETDQQSEE